MFVTFEGTDGAGKSTAMSTVASRLVAEGFDILSTREPGAGSIGQQIRNIVLNSDSLDRHSELFLFLADRANHVATVIQPALSSGKVVLCDRFADSTIVYQGYARGLEIDILRSFNLFATNGLKPDLTLLFDIDPEVGLGRLHSKDRIDSEPLAFHKRVRAGFASEAERDPARWSIVDASKSPEDIATLAYCLIRDRIG